MAVHSAVMVPLFIHVGELGLGKKAESVMNVAGMRALRRTAGMTVMSIFRNSGIKLVKVHGRMCSDKNREQDA